MITVFIGTYNRQETLERTVQSYKRFKTPHELCIVDNGTNNNDSLQVLARLESQVKKVYNLPACNSMEEATDNFNVAVRDQYHGTGGAWFAISEADVCFDGTDPWALEAYKKIAIKEGAAVGPHLRVDAHMPKHYPLRTRVLACETWMLYKQDMQEQRGIFYCKCQTDTTFHLFPRTRFFNRLKLNPIRVGPPFDAMHLDWYLNIFHPNRENPVYIGDQRPVGSWGKAWLRDFWFWFQESPAHAFEKLSHEPLHPNDLCNVSFILSWCHQYGIGTEVNLEKSLDCLHRAIPYPNDHYWPFEENWMKMVYDNDLSPLGW